MPTAMTIKAMLVSAAEGPSYAPPAYHRAAGKEALVAITPRLQHIEENQLASVRVDVQLATYTALGVVGFVCSPSVRSRFEALPTSEFDMENLDGLQPACFAMLYAFAEARAADALEDGARLPPPLAAEAQELEARMQTVCEYQLADDAEIKPELDRLRPGSGYRDLANDLMGYARIYELRSDAVKGDQKNYRDEDAARAEELAGIIMQTFAAMTARSRAAYDVYVRVWTLLTMHYDEVRSTGLWLFRKDPLAEQRFPSLYTAGRPNATRSKKVVSKGTETGNGSQKSAGAGELGAEAGGKSGAEASMTGDHPGAEAARAGDQPGAEAARAGDQPGGRAAAENGSAADPS